MAAVYSGHQLPRPNRKKKNKKKKEKKKEQLRTTVTVIRGCKHQKIEGTERLGRRCKQLLDDLKEMRRYWKFKKEALYRTVWTNDFGRGYAPVVRKTA